MATTITISLLIIIALVLVYAAYRVHKSVKAFNVNVISFNHNATNLIKKHQECENRLAHIQPGKMYERLEWLIPKLETAISGIESVQGKVETMQGTVNNHEKRLTDIEKIIKRWDEK